jgi:hypothetical protein
VVALTRIEAWILSPPHLPNAPKKPSTGKFDKRVSSFGTLLEIARDGGGALTLLLLFKTSPGINVRNLAATEISLREAVTAFGLLYMGGFPFFGGCGS